MAHKPRENQRHKYAVTKCKLQTIHLNPAPNKKMEEGLKPEECKWGKMAKWREKTEQREEKTSRERKTAGESDSISIGWLESYSVCSESRYRRSCLRSLCVVCCTNSFKVYLLTVVPILLCIFRLFLNMRSIVVGMRLWISYFRHLLSDKFIFRPQALYFWQLLFSELQLSSWS